MIPDLIAWLCRSPRRLIVSAAVMLSIVLIAGSTVFGNSTGGATAGRAGGAATTPSAQVPNADPFVRAAVAFVREWSQLKPGESAESWRARVTPLSTPELAAALKTTDPANLPGVGPNGEPVVRFVAQTSSLIAIPLSNGSSVLVTVVFDGPAPLVSDIQPNVGD